MTDEVSSPRNPEYEAVWEPKPNGGYRFRAKRRTDVKHERAVTPGWDTKTRCECGAEFVALAELNAHLSAPTPGDPNP